MVFGFDTVKQKLRQFPAFKLLSQPSSQVKTSVNTSIKGTIYYQNKILKSALKPEPCVLQVWTLGTTNLFSENSQQD